TDARHAGVVVDFLACDSAYGRNRGLRQACHQQGLPYVVRVPVNETLSDAATGAARRAEDFPWPAPGRATGNGARAGTGPRASGATTGPATAGCARVGRSRLRGLASGCCCAVRWPTPPTWRTSWPTTSRTPRPRH